MDTISNDYEAIMADVAAAGKTVMHIVLDGNYAVMEYDGENYCTPYSVHTWVKGSGLIAGHYFETLEDAKAYYRRYYENYGFVVC